MVRVAVGIVPARVHDAAVVQDAGLPLRGLGKRQRPDVLAAGVRAIEQEVGEVPEAVLAADVGLRARADEGDPAVGQIAGVEILDQRRLAAFRAGQSVRRLACQLPQTLAVDPDLPQEELPQVRVGRRVVAECERHPARVERQIGVHDGPGRQPARQQRRLPRAVLPVVEHDQPRSRPAVTTQVLARLVRIGRRRALVHQQSGRNPAADGRR